MEYRINRYPGKCHGCGYLVADREGYVELKKEYRKKARWLVSVDISDFLFIA